MKLRTTSGKTIEVSERYRKGIERTRNKYGRSEPVQVLLKEGRIYLSCYGRIRYECPAKVTR